MVKRTEQHEQEFIDACIEAERIPNHDTVKQIGKIIIERTDLGQAEFDNG